MVIMLKNKLDMLISLKIVLTKNHKHHNNKHKNNNPK